jgi:hypothetical protein
MAQSTSKTDVANRALRKMGANKIGDIADTTDPNAIIMLDLFDDSLAYVLGEGFFGFATKRHVLVYADEGETNEWEKYDLNYIYDKPADFVRIVGWSIEQAIVREEGDYLLSDYAGMQTTRTVQEDGVDAWSDASVSYALDDYSENDDSLYYCKLANTSSAADEPGVGANWETYWTLMTEDQGGWWRVEVEVNMGILYVYFNDTVSSWPTYFKEAVVDRLALDASFSRIQSTTATDKLEARYDRSIRTAKAKTGQGQTPQTPKADAWLNAKYDSDMVSGARRIFYRS